MLYHDLFNIVLTFLLLTQAYIYYKPNNIQENTTNDNKQKELDAQRISFMDYMYKYWFLKDRDYKTVYDPLSPPEKRIESRQYPFPNRLFGERTRGEADDYQLVGLLYNTTINKNYQLFGRRTYPGSYEWEYYIRGKDSGGLEIKFPIQNQNKQEIMDGSTITIPIDSNPYTVSIYNYDAYRYNPYVL
jgi:hypothetical protein